MPATCDAVHHLALALPGVVEGNVYGMSSLHVGRALLGRLREDGETLVLKVDPVRRTEPFAAEPDTFYTTDHYRGHPVMLVNLLAVREGALPALVEGAWRLVASRRQTTAYDQARLSGGRNSPTRVRRSATIR